jgi:thiamine biosynthesis lipoprotein
MTITQGPRIGVEALTRTFTAMASTVNLRVLDPARWAEEALSAAERVFRRIEASCSRFDPTSALMRANAEPDQWHVVPPECYQAIAGAAKAHRVTGGLFDPRCLRTLEAWGYDRSLPFAAGAVTLDVASPPAPAASRGPWLPGLDPASSAVRLGPEPIDLGGIGKGLAVRMAADELRGAGMAALVEAGGDCQLLGAGPEGDGWNVAVEDPRGSDEPAAVLRAIDAAVATSSVRLRTWHAGGRSVHHLVDPRTGEPGRSGLVAVTVASDDAARAEVWSKALLLAGANEATELADRHQLAALWIDDQAQLTCSPQMQPLVIWRPDHVS